MPLTREHREGKGLKRAIDLTGINKVPIFDKCPVDKSPPIQIPKYVKMQGGEDLTLAVAAAINLIYLPF